MGVMDNLGLTETETGARISKNQQYTLENVAMLKPQKVKTIKETQTETSTENEINNSWMRFSVVTGRGSPLELDAFKNEGVGLPVVNWKRFPVITGR